MSRMRRAIEEAAQGPVAFPEGRTAERTFVFARDFLGFSGHFPGRPVLPAVVQVLTAVSVGEALLESPRVFAALENAKFLLQVGPDAEVSVLCKRREGLAPPAVDVRISVPEGVAASFRLVFGEEREGR